MTERLPGIRPRQNFSRQLDLAARWSFPAATSSLLLLAFGAPIAVPGRAELQQCVALGCVFFWSLSRPASMPPLVVFGLGLLADLLGFAPLGVTVAALLGAHAVATTWRRELARGGFVVVWLTFVAVSVGAAVVEWALTSLLALRPYPIDRAVLQAGLGIGVYPVLSLLLVRAHRTLAEPSLA